MSIALAASMILGLAACGNEPTVNSSKEESKASSAVTSTTESSSKTTEVSIDSTKNPWDNKTYRYFSSETPTTWNPLDWQSSSEGEIISYLESPFYDYKVNAAGDNYEIYCCAAAALPVDVTSEYAGVGEWGIPADAKDGDGWAYRVKLRDDLCWEDGTPIHAADFVDSFEILLNPEMKNYRASDKYDATLTPVNAENYYWQGEKEGTKKVTWDEVGLKATGENELTYILNKPCNEFYAVYDGSFTLVKKDLYESLIKQTGDIKKSEYCTSLDTTMSWGKYKMVEYQEDKLIRYEKNDKWFGWNDTNYEGRDQLSYDAIECQVIKEHATALQMFLQGKIESIGLNSDDLKQYGASDYLHLQPKTYTSRLSFNTDREKLRGMEKEGICKVMPSYRTFRKAFSRMINRKEYCATCTSCHIPGLGLFNRLYVADPATGILYRDTPRAEQALLNVYNDGEGNIDEVTGYDLEEARSLFQQAYEEAKANGDYKDGDLVEINFMLYKDSEYYQKIVNHFDEKLQDALKGTGFEGHAKIKLVPDEDYYGKAAMGDYDAILTSVGGASMNTPILLNFYCFEDGGKDEYGFHPSTEKFTAKVGNEEYTMTFQTWSEELTSGRWANADPMVRSEVLAVIEEALLDRYETIPLYYQMSGTLLSHRLSYESDEFLPIVGFGKSIMSMDDDEWDAYIKENGGKLTY